jgi:hypothetical protein
MRRTAFAIVAGVLAVASSGCATAITNRHYQKETAIRLRAEGQQVEVGIDLLSLREVAEHPGPHFVSLLWDTIAGIGAYKIGEDRGWWGSSTETNTDSNNGDTSTQDGKTGIVIEGDNNSITVNESNTTRSMAP